MYDETDYQNESGENLTHMQLAQGEDDRINQMPENKKQKKKKHPGEKTKSAINGMIFGLCAALIFCMVTVIGNHTFLKTKTEETVVLGEASNEQNTKETDAEEEKTQLRANGETVASTTSGSLSIAEIAQNAMPSVVSITTKGIEEVRSMFGTRKYESQGAGSGIIIGQNDTELLIATNNHVIEGAQEVSVCFDDSDEDAVVSAVVKGTDASNDLAIVAVVLSDIEEDIMDKIEVIAIGDSESLEVGDQVVAIGNALGYGQSVTTGIVSALNREVDIDNFTSSLIQTDAAINPGNSGGALLNMNGELIGINSAKYASETVEGMGYAIPITTAKPILESLMNRETRELASDDEAGFLGVSCQDVSDEAVQYYDMPKGVYIAEVEEGGAADKAGIRKGDIITKFDGLTVTGSEELRSTIAYYKQGETVEVVLMRSNNGEYKEQQVSVTLAKSEAIEEQKLAEAEQGSSADDIQNDQAEERDNRQNRQEGQDDKTNPSDGSDRQIPDEVQEWFQNFFGNGGF